MIDAELEGKKMWEADTGATRNFKDAAGHGMVPYTEAKARWGDGKLYLMLYAGDLDLEGTVREHDGRRRARRRLPPGVWPRRRGARHLRLGAGDRGRRALPPRQPTGRVCDRGWESQARVAVDRDGTLNKIGDNDEEWVVEMAVPLAALGVADAHAGTRIPFSVARCEVGHGSSRGCGGWGTHPRGELALGP